MQEIAPVSITDGGSAYMKKTMSVRPLEKYCERTKFCRSRFHSEKQTRYQVSDPCKAKLEFPVMTVCENPNLLCLKSAENTLILDRIQRIKVDTESSVFWTIITVFCGDFKATDYDQA